MTHAYRPHFAHRWWLTLTIALAAVVGLAACTNVTPGTGATTQPATPTGQFVSDVEQLTISIAVDKVVQAIAANAKLSPAERAAATKALSDLPGVIANPSDSAAVQTAWDAALPFIQQYSTGSNAVIGPETVQELTAIVNRYVAALKATKK